MKNFFHWLLTSSEDPTKLALTVKGALGVAVSVAIMLHLSVGADQLNAIVDGIVQAVTIFASLVSAVAFVVGLIRKLKATLPSNPIV